LFGKRLRQQQFTQNDFALNSLNRPTPVGNFATRFSGSWMLFNWMGTQEQIKGARFAAGSAAAMSEQVQQGIVLKVVEAYQAVLFAERRIAVAEHEQATAEALLGDAKGKVKAGLAVDSDMQAAKSEQGQQGIEMK
jgi:outer membrane protein TolC